MKEKKRSGEFSFQKGNCCSLIVCSDPTKHRIKSKNTQQELQELEKEISQPCWLFYILSPSCCMIQWSLNPLPLSSATTISIMDPLLLNCNQFSYQWRIVWKEQITSASWHGKKPQLVQDWVLQYALSWAAAPSSSQADVAMWLSTYCSLLSRAPESKSPINGADRPLYLHTWFIWHQICWKSFQKTAVLPLRVLTQFVSVTFCRR
jgi:hypothetical protein